MFQLMDSMEKTGRKEDKSLVAKGLESLNQKSVLLELQAERYKNIHWFAFCRGYTLNVCSPYLAFQHVLFYLIGTQCLK